MKSSRIELISDPVELAKELSTGLRGLNFDDNFDSFQISLTLAAGEERDNIRNQLTVEPTRYIIVFQTGNGLVTAGDAAWTSDYISFKNHGAAQVTVKIIILR